MPENVFKCIIAGGREFDDYELLKTVCNMMLCLKNDVEIVYGGANGADKLGKEYAEEKGYSVKPFPANWTLHGKAAGPIRNEEMAQYADGCIVFWDGKSKGTKSMIDFANKYKLKLHIEYYNQH